VHGAAKAKENSEGTCIAVSGTTLYSDWRDVEDHPQPLVVHTAGTKAGQLLTFTCGRSAIYLNGAAEGSQHDGRNS